jgi:hypothetical protein
MTTQGKDDASTSPKCHATVKQYPILYPNGKIQDDQDVGRKEEDDDDDRLWFFEYVSRMSRVVSRPRSVVIRL